MSEPLPWAAVDLDGVLADVRWRLHHLQQRPKDWDAFFAGIPQDPPLSAGISMARRLADDHRLVYVSGRPERTRADTQAWLDRHDLPAAPLRLRRDGDHRPARLVKVEIVRALAADGPVGLVVDDDPDVCAAIAAAGWPTVAADWGLPDAVTTGYLRQAQEELGRT